MTTKKEYMKEYYNLNKDKWKADTPEKRKRKCELQKVYSTRHSKQCKEREHNWIERNYEQVLYNQTKRSSSYRKLDFNLDLSDIVIPEICPYLNTQLTRTQGKGIVWSNASVDRIDNSRGYVKGNIMIISRLANSMKQQATIEQLITFAQGVVKLHSKVDFNEGLKKEYQE